MSLVNDDGVVLLEIAVALHGVKQNSVSHDFHPSFGTHFVGEANLVANQ